MIVEITKLDIKNGIRKEANSCPLAIAIRRICETNQVWVSLEDVYIRDVEFYLPTAARKFISNFDAGKRVKPAKFTLRKKYERRTHTPHKERLFGVW